MCLCPRAAGDVASLVSLYDWLRPAAELARFQHSLQLVVGHLTFRKELDTASSLVAQLEEKVGEGGRGGGGAELTLYQLLCVCVGVCACVRVCVGVCTVVKVFIKIVFGEGCGALCLIVSPSGAGHGGDCLQEAASGSAGGALPVRLWQ